MYKKYDDPNSEIGEALIRIQHHWKMIEMETGVLRNLSHLLADDLQLHLNTLLQRLHVKLQEATIMMDSVFVDRSDSRLEATFDRLLQKKGDVRLTTRVKRSMDKMIADLDEWHRMLEPSWFLLALVQGPAVDRQLLDQNGGSVSMLKNLRAAVKPSQRENSSSIFLQDVETLGRSPVLYSKGEFGLDRRTGGAIVVETLTPDPTVNMAALTKNVRNLARILAAVEPMKFGILACRGVVKINDSNETVQQFQFVFNVPAPLHTPVSLRQLLLTEHLYPLEHYFQLAKQVARSVMFVHTADFVHKNIRPESVMVFRNDGFGVGAPFLMGFENFRPTDAKTYLTGDSNWEKDLYRHPTRQGVYPQETYRMQHDIYSLGVCLLEIGLWDSFIRPGTDGCCNLSPRLNISRYLAMRRQSDRANGIKRELIDMAEKNLPNKMGTRYAEVVISCLSCLDKDNDFGHERELLDNDGILVGVRYIEKILMTLEKIVL